MNKNEWLTIKTILSLELDKVIRDYGLPLERLNQAYFDWTNRVERHIHITNEAQTNITPQEREIIEGFAQTSDLPTLTPLEIEYMTALYRVIREK